MQSVQNTETQNQNQNQSQSQAEDNEAIKTRRISNLYVEVLSVWRESDVKKIQAVRMLAAAMEDYYLELNQPEEVQHISGKIATRLRDDGIKTWKHVNDYLEDKYKREYERQITDNGDIYGNNVLATNIDEIMRISPPDRSPSQMKALHDYAKTIAIEAEANRSAALNANVTLDDDPLSKKQYPHERTYIPDRKYDGPVHQAVWQLIDDLRIYAKDLEELTDDIYHWYDPARVPEEPMCHVIEEFRTALQDMRRIIAPAKDLKYATSMHNWFHTLLKFLDHGKHAGGVMTSIPSATHTKLMKDGTIEKILRALTREQVGDRIPYVEDLLLRLANSKVFFDKAKAFFRQTGQWDRDDKLRRLRADFNLALVRIFADDGDFLHMISIMREELMDEDVASRRIRAAPTLEDLA